MVHSREASWRWHVLEVACPAGGQGLLEEALAQNQTALASDPCSTSSWFYDHVP